MEDEMWAHYSKPASKQASMQWKKKDETVPRKFKSLTSAGKVMATFFWDLEGILLIEYLPQGSAVTRFLFQHHPTFLQCR